jgi:hypothetical protein
MWVLGLLACVITTNRSENLHARRSPLLLFFAVLASPFVGIPQTPVVGQTGPWQFPAAGPCRSRVLVPDH